MRTMPGKVYNVLFLCTHNSARSIMAECLLRRWGAGRFNAFSAGNRPSGAVHPFTLRILETFHIKTDGLRSKGWEEFAGPDAPEFDFVFTVCGSLAGQTCPAWPGQPMTAHWGVDDPLAVEGPEAKVMRAFRQTYVELESRIKIFASLPMARLNRLTLQSRLDQIGAHHATEEEMTPAAG
jgi:arsenate reductase